MLNYIRRVSDNPSQINKEIDKWDDIVCSIIDPLDEFCVNCFELKIPHWFLKWLPLPMFLEQDDV